MRRLILILLIAAAVLPLSAKVKEKGKFDLYQNGINKGYEKYKIELKKGTLRVSSEVRFKLPLAKAKRNYVDLYLYPVLQMDAATGRFEGYEFRLLYNDFTDIEITEAKDSATEVIDQDFRSYDLFHRSAQRQDDVMKNRIDLGVNSGKVVPKGQVLHFEQVRFSAKRTKEERLPKSLFIADSYIFCPYVMLARKALAMKSMSAPLTVITPQNMAMKEGQLEYMGTDKTMVSHGMHTLKRFDILIKNQIQSSFWVDRTGTLVEVIVPSLGLTAVRSEYEVKDFEREAPRVFRQSVDASSASPFDQKRVTIPSGDIQIGATLTLPSGKGPFPTILMVQDMEPLDRDGNEPSNPYSLAGTWKQLAFFLASSGFATLRFDSVGVGETGGDKRKIDFDARVRDCENLAEWLAKKPSTKDGKVICLTQGVGGWVAAEAASRAPVEGLVAIGYPAKDLLRLWKEQVSTIEDPQKRQKAYSDLDLLQEKLKSNKGDTVEFRGNKLNLQGVRRLANLDPAALASSLKVPCLFVYPTGDMVVMGFHKDLVEKVIHNGQTAIALEGLSHRLTKATSGKRGGGLVETKALTPVTDWIKNHFLGKAGS